MRRCSRRWSRDVDVVAGLSGLDVKTYLRCGCVDSFSIALRFGLGAFVIRKVSRFLVRLRLVPGPAV